jgi:GT2 family glycosyltransferase
MEPIIELMESDAKIAACQPKLLSYFNPQLFEYAGAAGGYIDSLGYPFSRGRIFDVCETDNGQYNEIQPVFWASGAALFVKTSVYHELGGLDPSFFAHQEEIDLCWRMQLAGYKVMACPDSVVYHVGAGTLPRGGRKVYLNFRNNLVMLCKNLPFSELVWKLPIRLILDAISAWKGLMGGDKSFFTAIMMAHGSLIVWIISGKIKISKGRKHLLGLDGVYRGSVVWEYFIKQRHRFQEIIRK